jgi:hypothetical protein
VGRIGDIQSHRGTTASREKLCTKNWTQHISELELRHSNRGREDGKGKGETVRRMCCHLAVFPSHPVLRLAGHHRVYL